MLKSTQAEGCLSVYLSGEIDHCSSAPLRREIEAMLADQSIRSLHLDFSQVSFIDSSGVGMIIGRYKTIAARGGSVSASGLNESVSRLYHMAGLHRIIPIVTTGGKHE